MLTVHCTKVLKEDTIFNANQRWKSVNDYDFIEAKSGI